MYTDNFVDREWLSIKNDSIPHLTLLKQIQTFAIWDNKWSKKERKKKTLHSF
jgi:hypothetical protein